MQPVIEARDLYKCYPGFPPVLRGVSIDVMPGEMVAIMGPSGCGKSTMLHILGMLHAPDSGSLEILGQNVLALNSEGTAAFRRGNMGFVMQASNLFEHSTVFENVEFPLIYENIPPQERWGRVIRALELVRLSSRVHYRSNRLSGGEQQRVAIARAMVNNPRILLADEPTGALDARTSRVIMENFRNLCHNGGVAMVMVTHDPKMAEYCDSIYTLEDGVLRCKKHDPPRIAPQGAGNFLEPPAPLVAAALVARHFPDCAEPEIMELATHLSDQRMLSRVYALAKNGFPVAQDGYSLPLAVRHMGIFAKFIGVRALWRRARGSVTLWQLWRLLPARPGPGRIWRRLKAFICGVILARWALVDDIRFFYAIGAREAASAAWVAAQLLRRPFAFAARPADIPLLGMDVTARARDASLITCSTEPLRQAFLRLAPDIPSQKVLFAPNQPLFASGADDQEANSSPPPGQPAKILAMRLGENYLRILLLAARILKRKGIAFQLILQGAPGTWLRLRIWRMGLRKLTVFTGKKIEGLTEIFRSADIFVAWPPPGRGMELALPWQLTEAMAFGSAICTLAVSPGMAPVLKDGENCLETARPLDAETLAKNLELLITRKSEAARIGESARQSIYAFLNSGAETLAAAIQNIAAVEGAANTDDATAGIESAMGGNANLHK